MGIATVWSFKELKEKEIVISEFFDWNLCFYTYFDYLEHFTNIGILYSTDLVEPSNTKSKNVHGSGRSIVGSFNSFTTPDDRLMRPRNLSLMQDQLETMNHESSHRKYSNTDLRETENTTNKTSEEVDANSLYNGGQMSEFDLSAQKNRIFCSSEKKAPRSYVSLDREGVMVSRFDQRTQRSLAMKMEDRVFELAKRMLDDFPVPTFRQMHMAFAIVKFVRKEFGLANRIFEEDYLFENIFQIEKLDYGFELGLVKEKYGVRHEAQLGSVHKTSYESISNKPKSLVKTPPTTANACKSNSKNNDTASNTNSHNSLPHIRKNSSSIILDMVSEENSKRPEICATGNNIGSGKAIVAKKYSTREYIKLAEDANQYIQENLMLAKKNIETVKNLKRNLFADDEGLFTTDPPPTGNPTDVSTTNIYAPISCRFRTYLNQSETANNNTTSYIFSTTAFKPRVTVADLYLKAPPRPPNALFPTPLNPHPPKPQTRPDETYMSCGNL
jgi:hypothetical protein